MKKMLARLGIVVATLSTALSLTALSLAALSLLTLPARPAWADATQESELVARVNSLRGAQGLAPLQVDAQLSAVARQWAGQLAAAGQLSHNPNLEAMAPAGWTSVGENVGYGSSVEEIEAMLVSDPPHLANLIDPGFQSIGVGVVDVGGTLWAVQDFMGSAGSAGYAPAAPAAPALILDQPPAADTTDSVQDDLTPVAAGAPLGDDDYDWGG